MSLAEQSLSLSSLAVIPCKREHQGCLGESGMAPRYLSWVLDHLVAASKVSKVSQEKLVEDSERISAQIQYLFLRDCIFRINLLQ